jgi:hypothetical protein
LVFEKISPEISDEWLAWRLYIAGKASLQELDLVYSLDDVIKANVVLDIDEKIQAILMERSKV